MKRIRTGLYFFALIGSLGAVLNGAGASYRQDLSPADIRVELAPVLTDLSSPLYVTNAHDGSSRLFIVEQPGRIKVLQPGATSPTVLLDITSKVLSGGERGLLGLAFHPQFRNNNGFFVDYTRRPDGATVIAEYRISASDRNIADPTEIVLLTIQQPFANHNGGMVEFGPDGFLYIGMGDGGSANDPGNRAQNTQELLGKILRIDVDHSNGTELYSSPPGNPFFGPGPERDEIYALGLRNPWRFSFDRATGQLYVADVGQGAREEIDIVAVGGNYGWRVLEGTLCTNLGPAPCSAGFFVPPIAEYTHGGGRCSITGGYVYRGAKSSLPPGSYVYGDYCTGEIFLLDGALQRMLLDTSLNISSFGEDESGEIYVVGLGGSVHRLFNPDAQLGLSSFVVRRRSTAEVLDPVIVRPNGKKFDIVVRGTGFSPGATVLVGGVEMSTRAGAIPAEELIARLRRTTLALPGALAVEVLNPDGARSNALTLQVLPAAGQ